MRTIEQVPENLADVDNLRKTFWKQNPFKVLACVDEQLASHGLEIVVFKTMDDYYYWTIETRGEKS